jgi:hypothetical protein
VVEWYYLLATFAAGLEVGRWVVYRELHKEREAEFDRTMAELRAKERDAWFESKRRAQKGGGGMSLAALICPDCGRERGESCQGWMDCMNSMRDQLRGLKAALAERGQRIAELEAAAWRVVNADTIKTPGVGRLEGIQRALLDLEGLLPEPMPRCAAALPQRPQDGDDSGGNGEDDQGGA